MTKGKYATDESLNEAATSYIKDAVVLVATIEETHPMFALDEIPERYEGEKQHYLEAVNDMTSLEAFELLSRRYLTALEDGHTKLSLQEKSYLLDLEGDVNEAGFFLLDAQGKLSSTQITHIGGLPVEQLFQLIDTYYPAENETGKSYNYRSWIRYKTFLEGAGCKIEDNIVSVTLCEQGVTQEKPISIKEQSLYAPYFAYEVPMESRLMGDIYYIDLNT